MLARHIMTSPVYTVPPDMPVIEATRLIKEKNISRLPVVDKGKLVGIATKDRLLRAAPSNATTLSLHELHYLYGKLTVAEIMQRNVVTAKPDDTIETCVRLAQDNHVGCLPVVEDGRVVGILTTNDLFYVVMNPILGIGETGSRVVVRHCQSAAEIGKAIQCVVDMGLDLTNAAYMPSRRGDEKDLFLHIAEEKPDKLVECMKSRGLDAEGRER